MGAGGGSNLGGGSRRFESLDHTKNISWIEGRPASNRYRRVLEEIGKTGESVTLVLGGIKYEAHIEGYIIMCSYAGRT